MASSIKINDGTPIDVELYDEKIVITRKKFNLKELLDQIPEDYEAEEINWGEPVGGEIW